MNKRDSAIHIHPHIHTYPHTPVAQWPRRYNEKTGDVWYPSTLSAGKGNFIFTWPYISSRRRAYRASINAQWFFIINARGVSIIFMSLIRPVTHDAHTSVVLLPFYVPRIYKEIRFHKYCIHLKACGRQRNERSW